MILSNLLSHNIAGLKDGILINVHNVEIFVYNCVLYIHYCQYFRSLIRVLCHLTEHKETLTFVLV